MQSSFFVKFLVILAMLFTGCSTKKDETLPSSAPQPVATPSVGTITGSAHIGLGSGDVKALAFQPAKLVQQNYTVLSDSEKQEITYDADQGIEAEKLGVISIDEMQRKGTAKVNALRSFENRLPEKEAIAAVATATTDADGNFRFEQVNPGTYWIFLDTQLAGNYVGWAYKVAVTLGVTTRVELNNTNLDYGFR